MKYKIKGDFSPKISNHEFSVGLIATMALINTLKNALNRVSLDLHEHTLEIVCPGDLDPQNRGVIRLLVSDLEQFLDVVTILYEVDKNTQSTKFLSFAVNPTPLSSQNIVNLITANISVSN